MSDLEYWNSLGMTEQKLGAFPIISMLALSELVIQARRAGREQAAARIDELEVLLEPFAWKDHPEMERIDDAMPLEVPLGYKHAILTKATVGDCRRAAAAIRGGGG